MIGALERAVAPVTFDLADTRGAAAVLLAAGAVLALPVRRSSYAASEAQSP